MARLSIVAALMAVLQLVELIAADNMITLRRPVIPSTTPFPEDFYWDADTTDVSGEKSGGGSNNGGSNNGSGGNGGGKREEIGDIDPGEAGGNTVREFGVGYGGLEQRLFIERQTITYAAFFSNFRSAQLGDSVDPDPLNYGIDTFNVTVPPNNNDLVGMVLSLKKTFYLVTTLMPVIAGKDGSPFVRARTLQFDIAIRLKGNSKKRPLTQGTTLDLYIDRSRIANANVTMRWPMPWDDLENFVDNRNRLAFEVAVTVRSQNARRARF